MRTAATLAIAFVASLQAVHLAAQDLADVEIETVSVAGNIHMLVSGAAANVGVSAGPDGVLIVDDKLAPLVDKMRAAIDALGAGATEFVLNTHWHPDHAGGNEALGGEATIVAHHNARERLSTEQEVVGMKIPATADVGLPVITFEESLSIHFNGEEIRAIHLPRGHTDGDIAVWFTGSNVVHMGDQYFTDMFPFVDMGTGGTLDGYVANLETVIGTVPGDATILAGHGGASDVSGLRRQVEMIAATTAIVSERIDAGHTLEEIVAAGLPAEWDSWSWMFVSTEQWITLLHMSLTGDHSAYEYHHHGHETR